MKRLKSIWIKLLVVVVSVAMMIGCFGGVALAFGGDVKADESDTSLVMHEKGRIPTKVSLGEEFEVPAGATNGDAKVTVEVKGPNGEKIDPVTAGTLKFVASDLGNYTVTYSNEDGSYSYLINCTADEDYFIYVANGGADIPTYITKGGSFELPDWCLAYNDEDGELVKLDSDNNVKTSWTLNGSSKVEAGTTVSISGLGTQILTLNAEFTGSEKTYSKDFNIISQNELKDESAPSLRNISNMPSSASINTKVTLPVATATDNYDSNVLIKVEVTKDGEKVKASPNINDQGYAYGDEGEEIEFDNDQVMSFYPREAGTYLITYTAYDDTFKMSDGAVKEAKVSSQHTYKIAVSDKTGPIVVDVNDDVIPTVWGLNSIANKDGDKKSTVVDIPIPEIVDNLDEFILNEAGETAFSGDIKMTVEVKNPSVTVAKFSSVSPADFKADSGKTFVIDADSSDYGKYYKDKADGANNSISLVADEKSGDIVLRINFDAFYDKNSTDEDADDAKVKAAVTGDWTVTFSFRDAANNGGYNNSQKVYTINISDVEFVDEEAPVIEAPVLPDYFIVGGDEDTYTVPTIVVSDDHDSRLTEEYKIKNGDKELAVENGEELEIVPVTENNVTSYKLVNSKNEELAISGDKTEIEFVYSATDDAGNTAKLKNGENNYKLTVYAAKDGFEVNNITYNLTAKQEENENIVNFGGFTVDKISQPEFIGYEITVKDAKGNSLDNITSYAYFATKVENKVETQSLNVKDIQFSPATSGTYELDVRVFDAKGNSYLKVVVFDATVSTNGQTHNPSKATPAWTNEGTARKSYMLQRKSFTIGDSEGEYTTVFKFRGGRYSLLGYAFTPIDLGAYYIQEYYVELDEKNGFEASDLVLNNSYGMEATEETSTTIEVMGSIASYHEKLSRPVNQNVYEEGAYYITDPIIAYSATQNYNLTVKYTTPTNESKTAIKVYEYTKTADTEHPQYVFKETDDYKFYGRYALILDDDGTYTLNVSTSDSSATSKSYTIKVGDVEAPQFTLNTNPAKATVGQKFGVDIFYRAISDVNKNGSDRESDITVFYKLIEPGTSRTEVSAVSGSISYSSYKDKVNGGDFKPSGEYTFAKSGEYTVEMTLRDAAGNESVQKYVITVSTATSQTPRSLTMLSTILIIVGVLLIIGVLVYLIRFRKHRA